MPAGVFGLQLHQPICLHLSLSFPGEVHWSGIKTIGANVGGCLKAMLRLHQRQSFECCSQGCGSANLDF